jgi:hypothetical protein
LPSCPAIQQRTFARTRSAIKRVADHVRSLGYRVLDIDLLGDLYRVIDLDAEVANRAFERMASLLGQLEPHCSAGLPLAHRRAIERITIRRHVIDAYCNDITTVP